METTPELRRLQRFLPFDQFEWLEVDFLSANHDTPVEHHLTVTDPYAVEYLEFTRRAALTVWDGRDDAETPAPRWTRRRIYLRSTVAPARARLLLVTRRGQEQVA